MFLSRFHLHVPRTIQFDDSLPFTRINGYKFHAEIVGSSESIPVIVVHGGPGQGYQYMKTLQSLSNQYRVIFMTREELAYQVGWTQGN